MICTVLKSAAAFFRSSTSGYHVSRKKVRPIAPASYGDLSYISYVRPDLKHPPESSWARIMRPGTWLKKCAGTRVNGAEPLQHNMECIWGKRTCVRVAHTRQLKPSQRCVRHDRLCSTYYLMWIVQVARRGTQSDKGSTWIGSTWIGTHRDNGLW